MLFPWPVATFLQVPPFPTCYLHTHLLTTLWSTVRQTDMLPGLGPNLTLSCSVQIAEPSRRSALERGFCRSLDAISTIAHYQLIGLPQLEVSSEGWTLYSQYLSTSCSALCSLWDQQIIVKYIHTDTTRTVALKPQNNSVRQMGDAHFIRETIESTHVSCPMIT